MEKSRLLHPLVSSKFRLSNGFPLSPLFLRRPALAERSDSGHHDLFHIRMPGHTGTALRFFLALACWQEELAVRKPTPQHDEQTFATTKRNAPFTMPLREQRLKFL